MRRKLALFASVCAFVLACGAVRADDNPAYTSWAKFKPGTSTTMAMASDAGGQTSKTETKTTLKEVTADKVVVEVAMSMEAGGQKMDMPAQTMEYKKVMDAAPATPDAPKDQPNMPKPETKTSEESVTVAAGTFKTKCTESKMKMGEMNTVSNVWTSDEVPGGMVKMEATTDGSMKSKTTSELKAFDKK
jgi:hypothetical protein